jgi:hypothetical protein
MSDLYMPMRRELEQLLLTSDSGGIPTQEIEQIARKYNFHEGEVKLYYTSIFVIHSHQHVQVVRFVINEAAYRIQPQEFMEIIFGAEPIRSGHKVCGVFVRGGPAVLIDIPAMPLPEMKFNFITKLIAALHAIGEIDAREKAEILLTGRAIRLEDYKIEPQPA